MSNTKRGHNFDNHPHIYIYIYIYICVYVYAERDAGHIPEVSCFAFFIFKYNKDTTSIYIYIW